MNIFYLIVATFFICMFENTVHAEIESQLLPIGWSADSLEATFEKAKKENKLVFLYWGAKWCPPCNQIKRTIFLDKSFQNEMQNYLPFYLDGDDPLAQSYSEKFKVRGYPTMLVLNGDYKELYRLPTGLQVQKYVAILKELRASRPSMAVIFKAIQNKRNLSQNEWEILANFPFNDQDAIDNLVLEDGSLADVLNGEKLQSYYEQIIQLAKTQGQSATSLRFSLMNLLAKAEKFADAESAIKENEGSTKEATSSNFEQKDIQLVEGLKEILKSESLVLANIEILEFEATKIFAFPLIKKDLNSFKKTYIEAMEGIYQNKNLSMDERLSSFVPMVEMKWVRAKDKKRISKIIKSNAEKVSNSFDRQAAMSTATYLLEQMELYQEAKAIALEQVKNSKSPYYFMSELASIEKKLNHPDEALAWSKKAFENARGQATRIQWGSSYFIDLVKTKKDTFSIAEKDLHSYFLEALKASDAFKGRNLARLNKLKKSLLENLGKEKTAQLMKVSQASCASLATGSDGRLACDQYFQ